MRGTTEREQRQHSRSPTTLQHSKPRRITTAAAKMEPLCNFDLDDLEPLHVLAELENRHNLADRKER